MKEYKVTLTYSAILTATSKEDATETLRLMILSGEKTKPTSIKVEDSAQKQKDWTLMDCIG